MTWNIRSLLYLPNTLRDVLKAMPKVAWIFVKREVLYVIVWSLPFVMIHASKAVRPSEITDWWVLCLDRYYGPCLKNKPNVFGADVARLSERIVCVLRVFKPTVWSWWACAGSCHPYKGVCRCTWCVTSRRTTSRRSSCHLIQQIQVMFLVACHVLDKSLRFAYAYVEVVVGVKRHCIVCKVPTARYACHKC